MRLDSVKVLATKPPYAEFEKNRRTNPMGKFMTMSEIQRRNAPSTADLVRVFGEFTVSRHGTGHLGGAEGRGEHASAGRPNVVIDGVDGLSVDDVQPKAIAGIEAYSDPTVAPARYSGNAECGVVVIWLRTGKDRRPEMKNGLQWNGYP